MNRVFVDMDGVLVDFEKFMEENQMDSSQVKAMRGAYLCMDPMPDAIRGVRSLIGMGWDVWIATKPPTGVSYAYSDKVEWVLRNLPELKRKIILTHDKGLLGDAGDYIIDDRPHKANIKAFQGTVYPFLDVFANWPRVLADFTKYAADRRATARG